MKAPTRVVVVENIADLAAHEAAWWDLANAAVEPNPFYEPCFLLPALKAFAVPGNLVMVLVFADPPAAQKASAPELLGFFPLERGPSSRRLPRALHALTHLRMWKDEYTYVSVPLIRRNRVAEAMEAFLDWLAGQSYAPPLLEINELVVGGPFHATLIDKLRPRRGEVYVRARDTRALFRPDCPADAYLARVLSSKDRREITRQRKRLQEAGQVEFVALQPGADLAAWAEDFLTIEASGWKGKNGTAFLCRPDCARFFREMFPAAVAAGRLSGTSLRLDGKPLAMQILLHARDGAYGFKTCYDEAYSRYAPGLLLEVDLMERIVQDPRTRWVDSAAVRDHPLFSRLYGELRCLEHCFLSPSPALGSLLAVAPVVRRMKSTLVAWARAWLPGIAGLLGEVPVTW